MNEEYIEIGDGPTTIHLRKLYTKNGERLEIHVPGSGHSVELDAIEVESLSWQTPETFIRLREKGPASPRQDT